MNPRTPHSIPLPALGETASGKIGLSSISSKSRPKVLKARGRDSAELGPGSLFLQTDIEVRKILCEPQACDERSQILEFRIATQKANSEEIEKFSSGRLSL